MATSWSNRRNIFLIINILISELHICAVKHYFVNFMKPDFILYKRLKDATYIIYDNEHMYTCVTCMLAWLADI